MLRSHGMFNPCLLPGCQVRVNTRNINKVEAEKVEFIARIKHTNRFQVIKQTMVEIDNSFIHISPHTFNPLIVHTLPYNNCTSSRATEWMHKEIHSNINIFTTLINTNARWQAILSDTFLEQPQDCVCTIVT